ncbi:MAG: hypothetical protein MI975_28830 [Cytophagales bacterium]|nr:hypothetical protein [Cytophagales bacterium]
MVKSVASFITALFLFGCSADMDSQVDLLMAFDFESGNQQWNGGVSDYPVHFEDSLAVQLSTDKVANSLPLDESAGLNISGENPYGDLFYFFSRKVIVEPGKKYRLDFEFLIYAQLADGAVKSLSEELYLKLGAVNYKPELEKVVWRNSEDYKTLNIDKGERNGDEGQDMLNIGSIKEYANLVPEAISGNTFDRAFEIESNKDGEIWILIGVDSGIRSNITFGLEALTVYYTEKK